MATQAYRENYALIDWSEPIEIKQRVVAPSPRSSLPCPMVITDEMPATEHVDGHFYTSKSSFRAVTRREGYIEVGTEKLKPFTPSRPDRKQIRAAIEKANARLRA